MSLLLAVPSGRRRCQRAAAGAAFVLAVALIASVAAAATASPSAAAKGPPEALVDSAELSAGEFGSGADPAWARYVPTTKAQAASLLARPGDALDPQVAERVYLVVMRGAFRHSANGQTGEYLAYIFWEADGVSNATGFTVSEEPVPMRSIGVSRPLHLEDVRDLYESRPIDYLWAFLFYFLPVILLAAAAVVCVWKRGSGWPYVLSACLAVAVAAWQTWITVRSMEGWDAVFHGIKLSILAVVVFVDLAAAGTLLMARSRREAAGVTRTGRLTWLHAGVLLLIVAAAFYIASLLWLASTGE